MNDYLTLKELGDRLLTLSDENECTLTPYQRAIYIIVGSQSKSALNQYRQMLCTFKHDVWMQADTEDSRDTRTISTVAPESLAVPKICISKGVQELLLKMESIPYCVIVQGKGGAAKQKLLVLSCPRQAVTAICHEVVNGYSVVFVGAMISNWGGAFTDVVFFRTYAEAFSATAQDHIAAFVV